MNTPGPQAPIKLFEDNRQYAARIAHIFANGRRLKWALPDLIQVATIGLWQAAQTYDPGRGHHFRAFADHRIRGSLLDWCRQEYPAGLRQRGNRAIVRIIPLSILDDPEEYEFHQARPEPAADWLQHEAFCALVRTLEWRQREALWLHYVEGMTMARIAKRFELSLSRVSQLLTGAMDTLRHELRRLPDRTEPPSGPPGDPSA